MARPRKRSRSQEQSGSTSAASMVVGGNGQSLMVPTSVHQGHPMGLGNVTGRFDITDGVSTPGFVTRECFPYKSFYHGWSKANDRSTQDFALFLGSADAATVQFYPITPMADAFNDEYGPVLNRLFQATLTSYTVPGIYQTARYWAAIMRMYGVLYSLIQLNHVCFHMNWQAYYPHREKPPEPLVDVAINYLATDISLASSWLPYIRFLEDHILPPWITAEIKRMLTPMRSVDLNARVYVPMAFDPSLDYTSIATELATLKDVIVAQADVRRVVQAYMPFVLSGQNCWAVAAQPVMDPLRLSGWYNASLSDIDAFGDTGDPASYTAMICNGDTGDGKCTHYTIAGVSSWEELKMGSVYSLDTPVVDTEFELLTPHGWGNIRFFDDLGNTSVFDGTATSDTDNRFEFMNFAFNRYTVAKTAVDRGMQQPGFSFSRIDRQAILDMIIMEIHDAFSSDEIRALTAANAGANVRLRKREVQQLAFGQRPG